MSGHITLLEEIDKLKTQLSTAQAENRTMREALEKVKEHCLCERNTYGFDYGETHKLLGKPGAGKRWLTPGDIARAALVGIEGSKG